MKQMRPAFTLIEILISVMILSISIVAVFKIYNENQDRIIYVSERNKHALEDSLFLGTEVLRYHKEKRSAYDLLQQEIKPTKDKSREILKTLERDIYIPEPLKILSDPEKGGLTAQAEEIKLRGTFSSSYYHFKILSF
jgi:prepilin-type N-terminal cleavage/methylation domain-containing protein